MNRAVLLPSPVRAAAAVFGLGSVLFVSGCTSPTMDLSSVVQGFRRTSPDSQPQSQFVVKTTAYCHQEADSQPYGTLTARGTKLRSSGPVRSAAADWSKYPVGTQFRIIGSPQIYEVDDYGSALVGTDTIDIYQPTMRSMRNWGAPVLGIEVVRWGSYAESEAILAQRAHRAPHVRTMLEGIREKQAEEAANALTPVSGRFFRRDA